MDDNVLPSLSLAVDGLTDTSRYTASDLEVQSGTAANEPPDTRIPDAPYDPEQLEVYGWESSFWGKILSYFRF